MKSFLFFVLLMTASVHASDCVCAEDYVWYDAMEMVDPKIQAFVEEASIAGFTWISTIHSITSSLLPVLMIRPMLSIARHWLAISLFSPELITDTAASRGASTSSSLSHVCHYNTMTVFWSVSRSDQTKTCRNPFSPR